MRIQPRPLLAWCAAVLAATVDAVSFTNSDYTGITAGQAFNLTWQGDGSPVTIILANGPPDDLKKVTSVAESVLGTSYSWTPPSTLTSGTYAFTISQSGAINYSPPFMLSGGAPGAAATSASGWNINVSSSSTTFLSDSAAATSTGSLDDDLDIGSISPAFAAFSSQIIASPSSSSSSSNGLAGMFPPGSNDTLPPGLGGSGPSFDPLAACPPSTVTSYTTVTAEPSADVLPSETCTQSTITSLIYVTASAELPPPSSPTPEEAAPSLPSPAPEEAVAPLSPQAAAPSLPSPAPEEAGTPSQATQISPPSYAAAPPVGTAAPLPPPGAQSYTPPSYPTQSSISMYIPPAPSASASVSSFYGGCGSGGASANGTLNPNCVPFTGVASRSEIVVLLRVGLGSLALSYLLL